MKGRLRARRETRRAAKARNVADTTTVYYFAAGTDASVQTSGGPTFAP